MKNRKQETASEPAVLFATFNQSPEMSRSLDVKKADKKELPKFEMHYPLDNEPLESDGGNSSKVINLRSYLDISELTSALPAS